MAPDEQRRDANSPVDDSQQKFYIRNTVGSMVALTAVFSLLVAFLG